MTRPTLAALLLLAMLAACGAPPAAVPGPASPAPTLAPTAPPTPAVTATPPTAAGLQAGARVDVGGRALFIQCTSPGDPAAPTVILEAGLAADHTSWAQVQPAAAAHARVCSYDRAGLGQSDPGPPPRDAATAAADLAALLKSAGVSGPYVLVGHSFGGLFARRFVADNPADVVGIVLVDAVHEAWWERALAALPPEAPGDSERLQSFRRYLASDVADPARNGEGIDIPATVAQVRAAGSLDARPLVVLSAGISDVLAPGLPPEVQSRLDALLQQELPRELAGLSADSTVVVVPDSGHNIPGQRPDMVVLAIQAVLAAVASRQ